MKDTNLTFRITAELKEQLKQIAKKEHRSMSQQAELYVQKGILEDMKKHGLDIGDREPS